ncbi:MAG: TolC family outer membrane protein [Luteimonas sp.]|nr:TolC family outer membrane protein [Luteimonas sp.]
MIRRSLAVSLVLALSSAPVFAEDLMQTYELARQGDPGLAIAESQREIAREGSVQARAGLLPSLTGSVDFGRGYTAGSSVRDSSRSYGASLNQSVFNWSTINQYRSARENDVAGGYDLDAANDELIVRTADAYFRVLEATETLAAAEAAEEAFQKQFDYADKRLEVGLAPITDVHEARAQYDSARARTILARNALKDAFEALSEITGQPISSLKALPDDFSPELPAGGDANAWVASALERNPTLLASGHAVRAAEHGVQTARGGHLPSLSLSAGYNNQTGWDNLPGLAGRDEGHSLGLRLSVPIFAGGATQSGVREAIARRDITQDQNEQIKRAIVRNTRNAYQSLVAGVSEIEARRLALVSAQSAYEASQVGLEVGTRTVIDVLINQQNLFLARENYAAAKYNYLRSRLGLEQAAGSLDATTVQDINRLLTVDVTAPTQQ